MAKKKASRGRPPLPNGIKKNAIFSFRLTAEEKAFLQQEGAQDWAKEVLLHCAKNKEVRATLRKKKGSRHPGRRYH